MSNQVGGNLNRFYRRYLFVALIFVTQHAIELRGASIDRPIVSKYISIVPEFDAIRRKLNEMKVHGWLFGGTAFTFGNAIDDLESPQDSPRKAIVARNGIRSVWDLYTPTQDLDVVIDADEETAKGFEEWLNREYPYFLPHFLGGKPTWEVRLLRDEREKKIALFENPQFLNIHNDSGSTGLIELTDFDLTEPFARDLRDWENPQNLFVTDLGSRKLHYLYHPEHRLSHRAQRGKNPEIFSVIRYLTKVYQEGWEIDIDAVQTYFIPIVKEFRGHEELHAEYGPDRLRRLIAKMYLQARNMEEVDAIVEIVGMKKRLWRFDDAEKVGNVSWWMAQRPLRSRPEGTTGQTAAELGITEVLIPAGDPWHHAYLLNPLYPRPNLFAQVHLLGDKKWVGTKARIRKTGEPLKSLVIVAKLSPTARLGIDFERVGEDGLVLLNRGVVSLADPSTQLSRRGVILMQIGRKLESLTAKGNDGYGYLSPNGERFIGLFNETYSSLGTDAVAIFMEQAVHLARREVLSRRDFRRVLARLLGALPESDDAVLEAALLVSKYPEIAETFQHHRGVFVDSKQDDSARVRAAFLRLEEALSCGELITEQRTEPKAEETGPLS